MILQPEFYNYKDNIDIEKKLVKLMETVQNDKDKNV